MIGGQKREERNFPEIAKRVGLFEAKVVAINPDKEEYEKKQLGRQLGEDDELEYLSESEEGNQRLRVDVYVEDVNEKEEDGFKRKYKIVYFLENKERENKDLTKRQYINSAGMCSWAGSENELREWFTGEAGSEREYRVAFQGEEELYVFITSWLGKLDYKNPDTVVQLDWKKLMKGNIKELQNELEGDWCSTFLANATIKVKETEEGVKEYQSVYNKVFFPVYTLRNFRLVDYDDEEVLKKLDAKKDKKFWEKNILAFKGEYGCKDINTLKPIKDYNPDDFLVSSDKAIAENDASY